MKVLKITQFKSGIDYSRDQKILLDVLVLGRFADRFIITIHRRSEAWYLRCGISLLWKK
jgi:hypothetical protein